MNKTAACNTLNRINSLQTLLEQKRKSGGSYGFRDGKPTECEALVQQINALTLDYRRHMGTLLPCDLPG